MRKMLVAGVIAMLSAVAAPQAAELKLSVTVPEPHSELDARGFTHVTIPGYLPWGEPGSPELPARVYYLALPAGQRPSGLEVRPAAARKLHGTHRIYPRQRPWPLSRGPGHFLPPDLKAFRRAETRQLVELGEVQLLRGFAVVPVMVQPVRYRAGTLSWYPRLEVTVRTTADKAASGLPGFRGRPDDFARIRRLVTNPAVLESYPRRPKAGDDPDYRYLVITSSELAACPGPENLQALLADKQARGISTRLETVAGIRAQYPGRDDAERIRAFITDMYRNHGTDFVLLAGDADLNPVGGEAGPVEVPVRGLWGDIGYGGAELNMPSDRYYACLDGDYDGDGDGIFGEPEDDVDTLAEVWVGRAAADSCAEVATFVHKTLAYQAAGGDWLRDVRMVGEILFEDYYGADDLEHVHHSSTRNGYATKGFSESSFFSVQTMYDRDLGDEGWGPNEILALLNSSPHIINHLGHSITFYNMRLTTDDIIAGLHNDLYFFEYTQGCYPGSFDNRMDPESGNQVLTQDSFAEHMTLDPHGAFAVVMNTRYGLGGGYSNALHRYFWDAAFGQAINRLGEMHSYSKDMIAGWLSDPAFRWVYYEATLFGDPELAVHLSASSAEPYLGLPAGPIQFVALAGEGDPDDQVITVRNLGSGTLDWTVASDQPWLSVTPPAGSAPSDVTLSVDTTGLDTGTWTATLTFTAPVASNSPQQLAVELHIIEVPATCAPYLQAVPDLDGVISPGEYDQAALVSLSPDPAQPDSRLYLHHDGTQLYLAFEVGADADVDDYDAVLVLFDGDNDGAWPQAAGDEGMYQLMRDPAWNAFVPIYNQGNGAVQGDAEWEPAGVQAVFGDTSPRVVEVALDLSASHLRRSAGQSFRMFVFFYDYLQEQGDYAAVAYWPWNLSSYDDCREFGTVTLGTEVPLLVTQPASLQFSAMSGGAPSEAQSLIVNYTASGSVDFSAAASQPWLQLSKQSAATPGHLQVWIDPADLTAGTHSAEITITAAGADNSPVAVPVAADVEPARPIITVQPGSLYFDAVRGADPPPAQQLTVTNAGAGELVFAAATADEWLQVTPGSGTAPASVAVAPRTSELEEGTRIGTVVISAPGAEAVTVPVSYRITLPPLLDVVPAQVELASMVSQGVQTVELEIRTARKTLPMEWRLEQQCDWLQAEPESGVAIPTLPSRVELRLDPTGLAEGLHQAQLTVTAPGAENSPLLVPVSWTIQPPPTLVVEPAALDFSAVVDEPAPGPQTLSITNGGGGELSWVVECPAAWLDCRPTSGLAPGELSVGVDPASLEPGTHDSVITISSPVAGNSPVTVSVSLTLQAGNQAPPVPKLLSPADGANIDTPRPALTLQNVNDPDGDTVSYDFELYQEQGTIPWRSYRGRPAGENGITFVEVDRDLQPGSFRWRARAVDARGLASAWSQEAVFTVATTGCACSSGGPRPGLAPLLLLLGLLVARPRRRNR